MGSRHSVACSRGESMTDYNTHQAVSAGIISEAEAFATTESFGIPNWIIALVGTATAYTVYDMAEQANRRRLVRNSRLGRYGFGRMGVKMTTHRPRYRRGRADR